MELVRENYVTIHDGNKIETISLEELKRAVDFMVKNVEMNNRCACDVPVFFKSEGKKFEIPNWALSVGFGKTVEAQIEFTDYYPVTFVAPDSRPAEGEYWASRGATDFDVSGFVKSKVAGERLRRMVRLVLEKDETKSWLDFRESEPNWIQFKFSAEEFDVEKLSKMSEENNGVLTLDILNQCKK